MNNVQIFSPKEVLAYGPQSDSEPENALQAQYRERMAKMIDDGESIVPEHPSSVWIFTYVDKDGFVPQQVRSVAHPFPQA